MRRARGSSRAPWPTPAEDDWIELYRATLRPLYAFVARRAGERALAEDVTQEAWLRAVSSWRGRGLPRDPLRWLERVAHNLLRNHFRRLRPTGLEGEELALDDADARPREPGRASARAVGSRAPPHPARGARVRPPPRRQVAGTDRGRDGRERARRRRSPAARAPGIAAGPLAAPPIRTRRRSIVSTTSSSSPPPNSKAAWRPRSAAP